MNVRTTLSFGKIDAEICPTTVCLTVSQIVDCGKADALSERLCEGHILLAARGYGSNVIRDGAAERKTWATIRPGADHEGLFACS